MAESDQAYLAAVDRLYANGATDTCGGVTPARVAGDLGVPPSTARGRLRALAEDGKLDEQWCPFPRQHRSYSPATM